MLYPLSYWGDAPGDGSAGTSQAHAYADRDR